MRASYENEHKDQDFNEVWTHYLSDSISCLTLHSYTLAKTPSSIWKLLRRGTVISTNAWCSCCWTLSFLFCNSSACLYNLSKTYFWEVLARTGACDVWGWGLCRWGWNVHCSNSFVSCRFFCSASAFLCWAICWVDRWPMVGFGFPSRSGLLFSFCKYFMKDDSYKCVGSLMPLSS